MGLMMAPVAFVTLPAVFVTALPPAESEESTFPFVVADGAAFWTLPVVGFITVLPDDVIIVGGLRFVVTFELPLGAVTPELVTPVLTFPVGLDPWAVVTPLDKEELDNCATLEGVGLTVGPVDTVGLDDRVGLAAGAAPEGRAV